MRAHEFICEQVSPDKKSRGQTKAATPTNFYFPDGRVWLSDHIKDRIRERSLNLQELADIMDYVKTRYAQDLKDLDPVKFAIRRKSDRFGIALSKQLMPDDTMRYIMVTAHPTLTVGVDQPVFYV
jgi:hypothetical protein